MYVSILDSYVKCLKAKEAIVEATILVSPEISESTRLDNWLGSREAVVETAGGAFNLPSRVIYSAEADELTAGYCARSKHVEDDNKFPTNFTIPWCTSNSMDQVAAASRIQVSYTN
ncbi:unnamed protein product [Protopolystoma xenopodis]|uniref:Uncharacterized protein n=1 Tax=Protopolystoma xenopodis TaxID=117903 RepID=A0A448XBM1_9PLAT|nr:unnamed protein product [Protopolystoma xenopodis]